MNRKLLRAILTVAALPLLIVSNPAVAQPLPLSDGTYTISDGSYSIEVAKEGGNIVVIEPNKRSVYTPANPGEYKFYNPNTDATYGIRVVDDQTIEAFKFQPGNVPTRLRRVGGPPALVAAPARQVSAMRPVDQFGQLAEKYRQLAISDLDDAQSWTACAAAALKRSMANKDEADAYGANLAHVLKQIAVDPSHSPCEDAIPNDVWALAPLPAELPSAPATIDRSADDEPATLAEAERARLNAETAAATRARVLGANDDFAARLREYHTAQDNYERDQAAYRASVLDVSAAEAEYRRKMDEYRAMLASGKYADPQSGK